MSAEHGTEQCDPMAAFAEMCKPADQHSLFKPFIGTFRATIRMWMGPGEPMVHTGTMVNTMELGGLFLMQDYKGDPAPGPFPAFAGKGFFGFNKHKKQFEGFWADNAASWMSMEAGQVDKSGKRWEMHSEMDDPMSGKPTTKRTVIEVRDNNHHSMVSYFTPQGGEESKCMEITYVRK